MAGRAAGFRRAGGRLRRRLFLGEGRDLHWRLCGVIAAVLWASTTVLIRATRLSRSTATKTLFYQLAVSAVVLPAASLVLGRKA